MKNSEKIVKIKKGFNCQSVTILMLLLNLYFFAKYTRTFLINSRFTLSIIILISFLFSYFGIFTQYVRGILVLFRLDNRQVAHKHP